MSRPLRPVASHRPTYPALSRHARQWLAVCGTASVVLWLGACHPFKTAGEPVTIETPIEEPLPGEEVAVAWLHVPDEAPSFPVTTASGAVVEAFVSLTAMDLAMQDALTAAAAEVQAVVVEALTPMDCATATSEETAQRVARAIEARLTETVPGVSAYFTAVSCQ